jgi:hypothetical protein
LIAAERREVLMLVPMTTPGAPSHGLEVRASGSADRAAQESGRRSFSTAARSSYRWTPCRR